MKSLSSRKTVFLSLAVIALILLGWGYTSGFFFERGLTPCAPPPGVMVDGVARANVYTWLDENGNGISDPGESPLPGVEIVYPALSKPTNEQGQAETSQFKPGCACKCSEREYVEVRAPEGYQATTPLRLELTGETGLYSFGFERVEPDVSILPEQTATPVLQTSQPVPLVASSTPSPTTTSTALECLKVNNDPPILRSSIGKLIFIDRLNKQIIRRELHTGEQTVQEASSQENRTENLAASPDGHWLVSLHYNGSILIESSDSNEKKQFQWKWGTDWNYSLIGWLDNQHVVFTRKKENLDLPDTVILNSVSGQWNEFTTDDFDHIPRLLDSVPLIFASNNIMPDPSLELLVHPMEEENFNLYVVLSDSETKQNIAKIRNYMYFKHDPLWAIDGKDFLIVMKDKPGNNEDWFRVMRAGYIEKLTSFKERFQYTEIKAETRSPNGEQAAFWLSVDPDSRAGNWIILNTNQPDKYFCVTGTDGSHPFPMIPIWSPDSRFVVLYNTDMNENGTVILVDTTTRWAAKIVENMYPRAWLVTP